MFLWTIFVNKTPHKVSCSSCFEAVISSCEEIIVRAGLPANYDIYWLIKKAGSDNLYQKKTQTNEQGDLVIDKADLPDGFLIPGRIFNLELRDGDSYLTPVVLLFGETEYTCIMVSIENFVKEEADNSSSNIIQFQEWYVPGMNIGGGAGVYKTYLEEDVSEIELQALVGKTITDILLDGVDRDFVNGEIADIPETGKFVVVNNSVPRKFKYGGIMYANQWLKFKYTG